MPDAPDKRQVLRLAEVAERLQRIADYAAKVERAKAGIPEDYPVSIRDEFKDAVAEFAAILAGLNIEAREE